MTKFYVWWTDQEESTAVHQNEALINTFPEYLRTQLGSRVGRAGRGRLWADREVIPDGIGIDPWPEKSPVAKWINHACSGGIVIRLWDFGLVRHLPGFVTDLGLNLISYPE